MKTAQKLVFSPIAWAKIQWMLEKAGKKEISGFGVSSEDDPLSVIDFCTIKQECSTVETEMDDVDLAAYMGRMAKKGIDPCRCMRIWIHSHPFATTKPSPSGTDETTLTEKTGVDSRWAIMMILGQGDPYIRLQIKEPLLEEPLELQMEHVVDWNLSVSKTTMASWENEYDRNIHEAPKVVATRGNQGGNELGFHKKSFMSTHQNALGSMKTFTQYYDEWNLFDVPGEPQWTAPPGDMDFQDYVAARREGFTQEEVGRWGDLVTRCTVGVLRNAAKYQAEQRREADNSKKGKSCGRKVKAASNKKDRKEKKRKGRKNRQN
jgi:hypothetical protein